MIDHFKASYARQQQAIEAKKDQATAEAVEKQENAVSSLYAAGALFLTFVGLVLLIVLLKIERNLRTGLPSRGGAEA